MHQNLLNSYREYFSEFLHNSFGLETLSNFQFEDRSDQLELADTENKISEETHQFSTQLHELHDKSNLDLVNQTNYNKAASKQKVKLDSCDFQSFCVDHFDVKPVVLADLKNNQDFIYPKINHGFWEQIYSVLANPSDRSHMRIKNPDVYSSMYMKSGFFTALTQSFRAVSLTEKSLLTTPGVNFALSLNNGSRYHSEIETSFDAFESLEQLIVSCAAIGSTAYFESMLNSQKVQFHDGAFPKKGLDSGLLKSMIEESVRSTESIVFVVPPHLRKITLEGFHDRQTTLIISGSSVHEYWAAYLYSCAMAILKSLQEFEKTTVFVQAGVFSALLGIFLADAKKKMGLDTAKLDYFDLGQVLDIANPDESGPWLKNHKPLDSALFRNTGGLTETRERK